MQKRSSRRQPLHPVRVVCRRTGLSAHVLRAWERRYATVQPARSSGGQRFYTDADVTRLQLLRQAVEGGRNISRVVALSNDELVALIAADEEQRVDVTRVAGPGAGRGDATAILARCIAAVSAMNPRSLEAELRGAKALLPLAILIDQVITPLLTETGRLWARDVITPVHEHVASAVVRRVLDELRHSFAAHEGARTIVVGTPQGQQHELGAMIAAVSAGSLGWNVMYVGASLPADEIVRAVRLANAQVVALSVLFPNDAADVRSEIARVRKALPSDIHLIVGGPGTPAVAGARARGVKLMNSLDEFRAFLRDLAASD